MRDAPLILIPPSRLRDGESGELTLKLAEAYAQAILAAGGLPWVAPRFTDPQTAAECLRRCDGLLLAGGDDIQPKLYTSRLSARLARTVVVADPKRDLQELLLIDEAFRQRKPVLAICRGIQVLNVALGGGLVVDIPLQIPNALNHQQPNRKSELVHKVLISKSSLMARIMRTHETAANSTHHQAVGRVSKLLQVVATSPDGVVEGVELSPQAANSVPFLLAVQCHPERLYDRHAEYLALFCAFVQASAAQRKAIV